MLINLRSIDKTLVIIKILFFDGKHKEKTLETSHFYGLKLTMKEKKSIDVKPLTIVVV